MTKCAGVFFITRVIGCQFNSCIVISGAEVLWITTFSQLITSCQVQYPPELHNPLTRTNTKEPTIQINDSSFPLLDTRHSVDWFNDNDEPRLFCMDLHVVLDKENNLVSRVNRSNAETNFVKSTRRQIFFCKISKPCHVGIQWIFLAGCSVSYFSGIILYWPN